MSGRSLVTRTIAAVMLAMLAPTLAFAQERDSTKAEPDDPRAVQPERPTVATHAHTVAPGYVEFEVGVQGDHVDDGSRAWGAPVVTKVGLGSHLQLNVSTPVFFAAPGRSSGLGDAAVGVKWRLLDEHPLLGDFALLPAVKFPTGSDVNGTGSGTTDLSLTVISSYELGPVSMDLNAIYTRIGASGSTPASDAALWTASFGAQVAGRLGYVVEIFGSPTIDGSGTPSSVALLTGPTFLADRTVAIDVGIITRLRGETPNSIYAGIVWNVGRLPGFGAPAATLRRDP